MPPWSLLMVPYRAAYAQTVARLVAEAEALGMDVALWAVDEVAPELARHTVGCGPGGRVDLLSAIWLADPDRPAGPVVMVDDDVHITRGDLRVLLAIVDECGFDLAAPSHDGRGEWSIRFTLTRPLSVARWTTFIEGGPFVVVGPRWRDRVLPLPPDLGMGWGLELVWWDLVPEGCRLGIVDAVAIHHAVSAGQSYGLGPEQARGREMLHDRGLSRLSETYDVRGRWWCWQRRPRWSAPS